MATLKHASAWRTLKPENPYLEGQGMDDTARATLAVANAFTSKVTHALLEIASAAEHMKQHSLSASYSNRDGSYLYLLASTAAKEAASGIAELESQRASYQSLRRQDMAMDAVMRK